MKSIPKPIRASFSPDPIERILSRYFAQLVQWSLVISRGDPTAAEEIVQDLCLHLTIAQPNLSAVRDLDAYLYICLRNMYVSRLARTSRERLRVIQIEDYDQVGIAVVAGGPDRVDIQNELLRICDYVVSRKYTSKSASYFILHFFLGYRRSDVALLARLPIAAIYNKLKDIRDEVREQRSSWNGLRVVGRGAAPEKRLLHTALPADVFLLELRRTVLDSGLPSCIPEKELIAPYRESGASPTEGKQLAHIAGCTRCLETLERALRLEDHDDPLDGSGEDKAATKETSTSFGATMRTMRRQRELLLERRPSILAIAVDGRVVAFHAIEGAFSSLTSRVESEPTAQFIEVFDEFEDRLAHIPLNVEAETPRRKSLSQQVSLSDDRSLQLEIRFDGLGIYAGAHYSDPALAPIDKAEGSFSSPRRQTPWLSRLGQLNRLRIAPWGVPALASLLLLLASGVAGYNYMHPAWRDVIARSQAIAVVPSPTETLHQTLRIEEVNEGKAAEVLGSIDIWRNSDQQEVRRLYDQQGSLLATSSQSANGSASDRLEDNLSAAGRQRQIIESGVWRSDLSTAAFDSAPGAVAEASRDASTIEITQRVGGNSEILSRTLVLDHGYRPLAETIRFRTAGGLSEVRLVQTLLRRVPTRDVPSSIFPPMRQTTPHDTQDQHTLPDKSELQRLANPDTADLEVSLLFELFKRNLDTGLPIGLTTSPEGRIRMTGTLSDAHQLAAIRGIVAALPGSDRIDFHLHSIAEATSTVHRGNARVQELEGSVSDAPAAGLVRNTMIARGLQGAPLKAAEQQFAASALSHAQAALQHAYALDHLAAILQQAGRASLAPDVREKWAQMVDRHSSSATKELAALQAQLNQISTGMSDEPLRESNVNVDPATFARSASDLRVKTQSINEQIVELFAGSVVSASPTEAQDALMRLHATLPFGEASRMHSFASRLIASGSTSKNEVGEKPPQ